MTRTSRCLPLLLLLMAACSPTDEGEPQPVDVLRYPADLALSGDGQALYVVGTNFDLAYNSGVLQAVDVARLEELADGVPEGEVGQFEVPWLGDGGVRIGSFGGRPAVAPIEEEGVRVGDRVFVPLRGGGREAEEAGGRGGEVAVVDLVGGALACASGDALDCRPTQVPLVNDRGVTLADPYSAAVVGGEVFVGTLRFQQTSSDTIEFFMARLPVATPERVEVAPAGNVSMRVLAPVPGREDLLQGGDLSIQSAAGAVLRAGILRQVSREAFGVADVQEEAHRLSLQADLGANQVYDLAFEEGGDGLWAVSRAPSALVTYAWDRSGPLSEAQYMGSASVPGGAARVVVLRSGDRPLLAVTSVASGALSFVDPLRQEVVAVLDGSGCVDPSAACPSGSRQPGLREAETDPGQGPLGLVGLPREDGARLIVADSDSSRLVVVDVPDLGRPQEARVRAVFSSEEMQP